MLRTPAICLLILIQLFAGSGRSVYLCVSSDGSISGIDSGPLFCTNCRHDHDSEPTVADDSEDSDQCGSSCCSHSHESKSEDDSFPATAMLGEEGNCDCEHLLISSESVQLTSQAVDFDGLCAHNFEVVLPPFEIAFALSTGNVLREYAEPPDIPATVAVLSTVIIRS